MPALQQAKRGGAASAASLPESSAFSQNEAVAAELPGVWHLPYA